MKIKAGSDHFFKHKQYFFEMPAENAESDIRH